VYALDDARILRLTRSSLDHYEDRARLHDEIRSGLPFFVPRLLDGGLIGEVTYTVEDRIPGRSVDHVLADIARSRREQALIAFADAALEISQATFSRPWFGEVLHSPPIRAQTWGGYLVERARTNLELARAKVSPHLPDPDAILERFIEAATLVGDVEPALVHGDYFPGNVMMTDDLTVSGVIDWSFLTQCGDRRMDLAAAVLFLEVERPWCTEADARSVERHLTSRTPDLATALPLYRVFYAIDLIAYPIGPAHERYCLDVLLSAQQGA
jgi:aminoglycoside phosphotransferase (APT) family kinase protein